MVWYGLANIGDYSRNMIREVIIYDRFHQAWTLLKPSVLFSGQNCKPSNDVCRQLRSYSRLHDTTLDHLIRSKPLFGDNEQLRR